MKASERAWLILALATLALALMPRREHVIMIPDDEPSFLPVLKRF